jgi:hypothetical protein
MMAKIVGEASDDAINGIFSIIYRLRDVAPLTDRQAAALRRVNARTAETFDLAASFVLEGDELAARAQSLLDALDRWFSHGVEPSENQVAWISESLRRSEQAELDTALLAVWNLHFPHHDIDAARADVVIEEPAELEIEAPEPPPAPRTVNGSSNSRQFDGRSSASERGPDRQPTHALSEVVPSSNVVDNWNIPPTILMALGGLPASNVGFVRNQGDSMVPTLLDGDVAVIDTRHTIPSPDGLYAVRDSFGAAIIKRLSMMTSGGSTIPIVQLMSDNPKYEARRLQLDEVRILGRVVRKFGHVT